MHTDRDATQRRITELYTKAADQLGSEKAPARLAGLRAWRCDALLGGTPVSTIAVHGRWSPSNPVVLSYVRANCWRDNVLAGIEL